MPPGRLRCKIIKDALLASQGSETDALQFRVLDMSMLPFTLYVRIQLPAATGLQSPLSLHLIGGIPTSTQAERFFAIARLPEPKDPEQPHAPRRILLVLMGEGVNDGRYRLALVRDRQHLAVCDVVKSGDQVRVATRQPAIPHTEVSPLLISGTHKSGTTWLEKVIDAHPDFIVLHEANSLNLFDPAGWARLVSERQEHFRHRNYIRWLNPAFDVEDLSRFLQISLARDLMLRLGQAWGSRYVADRTPGYSGLYMHLFRFWEQIRILHIVRHPLDVLASRLFHEANLERNAERGTHVALPMLQTINARLDSGDTLSAGDFVSDADTEGETLVRMLQDWRRDQANFLAASGTSPTTFHLVRYENLLERFDSEAGSIFAFLGIDPAQTDLASIRRRTAFETLSGGRLSGAEDKRSFFRKGIAGDWPNIFSLDQARQLWPLVADTAAASATQ